MTTRHHSTRGTVWLCLTQAITLAGLLLTLFGLPTDQPADGPDLWWRDATPAEQARHAVEQQRDLEAAHDQAQRNGAPAAPPAGAPTTTHKGSDHQ